MKLPDIDMEHFPTTNTRIVVTILAFIATAISYLYMLLSGKDAGIDESVFTVWLTFMSVWAGIESVLKTKKWNRGIGTDDEIPPKNRSIPPTPPVIIVPTTPAQEPDD